MSQFLRPKADVTAGWSIGAGAGTELWEEIDEVSPDDDAGYISAVEGFAVMCEVLLESATDPLSSAGHTIRVRGFKVINGYKCHVELYEGGTKIADAGEVDGGGVWDTLTYTLSGAEADAISDYADLRLRLTAESGSPGFDPESFRVTWGEMEIPDVPTTAVRMQPMGIMGKI